MRHRYMIMHHVVALIINQPQPNIRLPLTWRRGAQPACPLVIVLWNPFSKELIGKKVGYASDKWNWSDERRLNYLFRNTKKHSVKYRSNTSIIRYIAILDEAAISKKMKKVLHLSKSKSRIFQIRCHRNQHRSPGIHFSRRQIVWPCPSEADVFN